MTVCNKEKCTGCRACIDICPKKAISFIDQLDKVYAMIDEKICNHCDACKRVCQVHNPIELSKPLEWYQGWAVPEIRSKSSSGGYASAIMRKFIEDGGTVASCRLQEGDFRFSLISSISELEGVSGSKYVKSNPEGIYSKIVQTLKGENKVLFIGLPCQVAGLKKYVNANLQKQLYTIDLICHGTPSIELFKIALSDYGVDLNQTNEISFRLNNQFSIRENMIRLVPEGIMDRYTIGFLRGLFYTENCYDCPYARDQRVGDITLGDSWGTDLQDEEKNGISLALIQTEKGKELLHKADLMLKEVNLESAIMANKQLQHPSSLPDNRKVFFKNIKSGLGFKKAVTIAHPKTCIKQDINTLLIRFHNHRGGGMNRYEIICYIKN